MAAFGRGCLILSDPVRAGGDGAVDGVLLVLICGGVLVSFFLMVACSYLDECVVVVVGESQTGAIRQVSCKFLHSYRQNIYVCT